MKLHFTEKALRLIAQKALAKNTGARGLRAILESILTEAMYEVYKTEGFFFFFSFCGWEEMKDILATQSN